MNGGIDLVRVVLKILHIKVGELRMTPFLFEYSRTTLFTPKGRSNAEAGVTYWHIEHHSIRYAFSVFAETKQREEMKS